MPSRLWLLAGCLVLSLPTLNGCARVSVWLQAGQQEEDKDKGPSPEKIAEAKEALRGTDAEARVEAVADLCKVGEPDALAAVIPHINDPAPEVAAAALTGLRQATGFPEKTREERQLDPEAYDRQLALKAAVAERGGAPLVQALESEQGDVAYQALLVVGNLITPPLSPAGAVALVQQQFGQPVVRLALRPAAPVDTRLLAIATVARYGTTAEAAALAPNLQDAEPRVRAETAFALAQLPPAKDAAPALLALANDPAQPGEVRWPAALALGRLGQGSQLTQPLAEPAGVAPLEAYRGYALASSGNAAAAQAMSAQVAQATAEAAAALEIERKRGYR